MMNILSKIWRLIPYPFRMQFIRLTQAKFTVSVVAIVLNGKDEILVLDHFIRPGATWGLPGGFIEANEYPDIAIRREIKEETHLELADLTLLRVRTVRRHVEFLYLARSDGDVVLNSSEIRDFGWFEKNDLPAGVSKVQKELIDESVAD